MSLVQIQVVIQARRKGVRVAFKAAWHRATGSGDINHEDDTLNAPRGWRVACDFRSKRASRKAWFNLWKSG